MGCLGILNWCPFRDFRVFTRNHGYTRVVWYLQYGYNNTAVEEDGRSSKQYGNVAGDFCGFESGLLGSLSCCSREEPVNKLGKISVGFQVLTYGAVETGRRAFYSIHSVLLQNRHRRFFIERRLGHLRFKLSCP